MLEAFTKAPFPPCFVEGGDHFALLLELRCNETGNGDTRCSHGSPGRRASAAQASLVWRVVARIAVSLLWKEDGYDWYGSRAWAAFKRSKPHWRSNGRTGTDYIGDVEEHLPASVPLDESIRVGRIA